MSNAPTPLAQPEPAPAPGPEPVPEPQAEPMPIEPSPGTGGTGDSGFLGLEAIWEQITGVFGGAGALAGGLVVLGGVFLLVLILTDA